MRILVLLVSLFLLLPHATLAQNTTFVEQCVCSFTPMASTTEATEVFENTAWIPSGQTPSGDLCQTFCQGYAADNNGTFTSGVYSTREEETFKAVKPVLGVAIPGFTEFQDPIRVDNVLQVAFIGEYVAALYRWLIGVMAVFAVIMIMVGGVQYMLQGGSKQGVEAAKTRITNALIGMVILLGSYVLLYTTNPQLTILPVITIEGVNSRPAPIASPGLLANPGRASTEKEYRQLGCPSREELEAGVEFFATAYYKPGYGEKAGYQSFECNIGMQCSCPQPSGRSKQKSCSTTAGTWAPCNPFPEGTNYCTNTSSGVAPEAYVSAAVSKCIPKGTVFKVFNSGNTQATSAVWRAHDTGGWIKGRRVDLFVGTGQSALTSAQGIAGKVTIKFCPDNDPSQCPSN